MTPPQLTHRPGRPWWRFILALAAVAAAVSIGPAATAQSNTPTPAIPPALTWSTVSPPATPPPLANASAVYDSDNKTVVLFGGLELGGSLSNDTWVWNGSTWADYPGSEIQAPPARQLASMAFDPDLHQLILFGGEGADGQLLSDTWAWNGASWYQQSNQAATGFPGPREAAAMAFDGAGNLILFGGTGIASVTDATPPGPTSTTTAAGPAGSAGSSSAVSTTGSAVPLTVLADTWLWTRDGWVQGPVPSRTGPGARSGAAMAFHQFDLTHSQAILYGGESTPVGSAVPRFLNDSWVWTGFSWTRLAPRTNPTPRTQAVMVGDDLTGGLVLFGGGGPHGALSDTWLWNGASWSATPRPQASPVARTGAAGAYDPVSHQLIVFGGVGPGGSLLADTLALGSAPLSLGTSTSTATPATGTKTSASSASASHGANVRPPSGAETSPATVPGATTAGPAATRRLAATLHVLHRGDLVTLTGSGFKPDAEITITFHSRSMVVGRASANAAGDFSATVAVPESSPGGTHHFEAAGLGTSGSITQVATVTVVGVPTSSSTLQRVVLTGAAFLIPAVTWGVLVGVGWWRRRSTVRLP
jgi:hypothetical protein